MLSNYEWGAVMRCLRGNTGNFVSTGITSLTCSRCFRLPAPRHVYWI